MSFVRKISEILGYYALDRRDLCTAYEDEYGFVHITIDNDSPQDGCTMKLGELTDILSNYLFFDAQRNNFGGRVEAFEEDMELYRYDDSNYIPNIDAADDGSVVIYGVPFSAVSEAL